MQCIYICIINPVNFSLQFEFIHILVFGIFNSINQFRYKQISSTFMNQPNKNIAKFSTPEFAINTQMTDYYKLQSFLPDSPNNFTQQSEIQSFEPNELHITNLKSLDDQLLPESMKCKTKTKYQIHGNRTQRNIHTKTEKIINHKYMQAKIRQQYQRQIISLKRILERAQQLLQSRNNKFNTLRSENQLLKGQVARLKGQNSILREKYDQLIQISEEKKSTKIQISIVRKLDNQNQKININNNSYKSLNKNHQRWRTDEEFVQSQEQCSKYSVTKNKQQKSSNQQLQDSHKIQNSISTQSGKSSNKNLVQSHISQQRIVCMSLDNSKISDNQKSSDEVQKDNNCFKNRILNKIDAYILQIRNDFNQRQGHMKNKMQNKIESIFVNE